MRTLAEAIPPLAALLRDLNDAVAGGRYSGTDEFVAECRIRWTADLIATVDEVLPHWSTMASFADGKTLWHITIAMIALFDLDEYQDASDADRHLMEWTVLLHDIAKEPAPKTRDHLHGFRSAAVAAQTLPALGFTTTDAYPRDFADWRDIVHSAHRLDDAAGEPIPDNTNLPEIIAGIDRMFAGDGGRLLTAIALHQSVTVLVDWPSMAPLTPAQESAFITPAVASLQLPLMLADSGGWNLFDAETLASMYAETRAVFRGIADRR